MSNPVNLAITLAAAAANNIALSQSLLTAGNVVLDGALVAGGVATLTSAGAARQVIITSASDDTGITFTLYGTNATGNPISESFAGASGGVATSTLYYRTITRIAASGATAGDITVGTNGVGVTRVANIDTALNPGNATVVINVTGTVNYTLQWTVDDIQGTPAWNSDPVLATVATSGSTSYAMPISGVRILVNSGTGAIAATLLQSGLGS